MAQASQNRLIARFSIDLRYLSDDIDSMNRNDILSCEMAQSKGMPPSNVAAQAPLEFPPGELADLPAFRSERDRLRQLATGDLLTTGQAAQELGIRSVNTIKRWVYEGLLVGHRRGGRVLVSVDSVAKMLVSSQLTQQKRDESRLEHALEALDNIDEREVPRDEPVGQKPWEGDGRPKP